jgi:hypothetical protein
LHRVDRYAQWSSQHDIGLEGRVRERKLKETAVVRGFGGAKESAAVILTETLSSGGYRLS